MTDFTCLIDVKHPTKSRRCAEQCPACRSRDAGTVPEASQCMCDQSMPPASVNLLGAVDATRITEVTVDELIDRVAGAIGFYNRRELDDEAWAEVRTQVGAHVRAAIAKVADRL